MLEKLNDVQYVGDGVYVGHDGYQVWAYLDNGIFKSNPIAFDIRTFSTFVRYGMRFYDRDEEAARQAKAKDDEADDQARSKIEGTS